MTPTNRLLARQVRHVRVREKISGSAARPRLNVYKSHKNYFVQLIDDLAGKTLVAVSTLEPEVKGTLKARGNVEAAKAVGSLIAKRVLEKGFKQVVFDRGGNRYDGAIKALATAAREAGLEF
jgi:large subunit ribosomal protein L18